MKVQGTHDSRCIAIHVRSWRILGIQIAPSLKRRCCNVGSQEMVVYWIAVVTSFCVFREQWKVIGCDRKERHQNI